MKIVALLCTGLVWAATGPVMGAPCEAGGAREAADAALVSLFAGDGVEFANLVHPDHGLRVSPAAFIDVEIDRVLSRDEAAALWTDPAIHLWGYAEGSGEPIELTGAAYLARFVTGAPFLQAAEVLVDSDRPTGSTVDNSAEIYPEATRIDYVIDTDIPQDRAALRMAVQPSGECWYLVGLISDAWSP